MQCDLKLYVGPMFSGKSTKLLQQIDRYKIAKKNVLSFKPTMDTRYSKDGFIVTHNDIHVACHIVNKGQDIIDIFEKENDKNKVDVIAIDEAFMIEDIAQSVLDIFYRHKITVLVSSIDMSASRMQFQDISSLLSHATHIKKCKAVCTTCGEDASYTLRKFSINNDAGQIRVGGSDLYEPRCLKHHSDINF